MILIGDSMKQYVIVGHENPDFDSIVSGYLLEKLLKRKGYLAKFIIPDQEVDKDTKRLCQKYGIDVTLYQNDFIIDATYILVDHHDRKVPGDVVAIFDHHPTSKKIDCSYILNKRICSTAMLIYELSEDSFLEDEKKLVAIANFVDTISFRLPDKYRVEDIELTKKLCLQLKLDYKQLEQDGMMLTSLTDLKKSYCNGLKKYQFGSYFVMSSYIQVKEVRKKQIDTLIHLCKMRLIEENLDLYVFMIETLKDNKTMVYYIKKDGIKKENYSYLVSRGSVIMPSVEAYFLEKK